MAFVYWIHRKDHTDILTQGYVGITTKPVKTRYDEHLRMAFSDKTQKEGKYRVHHSIYKHIEDIVVTTVCECSLEYALFFENKLRSSRNIGWNISIGGVTTRNGVPQSDYQKKTAQRLGKLRGLSDKARDEAARVNKGRIRSESEILKRSNVVTSRHLLDNVSSNMDVLSRVNDVYSCYLTGYRLYKTSTTLDIPYRGMRGLFHRFDKGYNPLTDERMQSYVNSYLEKYGVYVEGNETIDSVKVESATHIGKNIFLTKTGNLLAYLSFNRKTYRKTFNVRLLGLEEAKSEASAWLMNLRISLGCNETENNAA